MTGEATQARFDRVADLVEGFETPYGPEPLSTVHWTCSVDGAQGINEVVRQTYAWNTRKRPDSSNNHRMLPVVQKPDLTLPNELNSVPLHNIR